MSPSDNLAVLAHPDDRELIRGGSLIESAGAPRGRWE